MEAFIDGRCVRLRNRHSGRFLYADEDWVGISVQPHGASLNAAWMVRRVQRGDNNYVLLQSAANGQYLTWDLHPVQGAAPRPVQRSYEYPGQNDVLWVVVQGDGGDVRVHNSLNPPNYLRVSNTTIVWRVDIVPPRPAPLPLQPQPEMMISYVLADDFGNFRRDGFSGDMFRGRSVFDLRGRLAELLGMGVDDITLCLRGGAQGRLIPLVVDLPTGHDAFEIIVLRANSTAALELRHPNVDAQ